MNFKKIKKDDGVTAVEYALIIMSIGIVISLVLQLLGSNISNVFCTIGDELASEPICESTNIIDNSTWYIDTSYIPTSLGGTAENWVCWVCNSSNGNLYGVNKSFENQAKETAAALEKFGKTHDIEMVYGVMDGDKAVTSYTDTYNSLIDASKGDINVKNSGGNYGSIEVVTKNGESYWYNTDYNEFWDQGKRS